ncbi:MAG: NAD(P)-dependent glycerol-3-phosphate dehydrogenase [Hyphomicrobiaceae bacterium]|nr:NAD(P)-dependent glycerol-3-phosphate dehydrogenase [Hyphomicrobiaceae bacterium]MCC0009245.1 NAD(P)-dependent glycerol-3-phosphate dehydrogenase [Hyphomicrobiaceae bacterium]
MRLDSIGVIGGGAWGTALAQTVRLAGRSAVIWAREAEVVDDINTRHVNSQFLPGIPLDPGLRATDNLADIAQADAILMVAPAQHIRTVAAELRPHLKNGQPIINCAKGIERTTGKVMGEVLAETVPDALLAALSGPSFAADVARGLPTALTIACEREDVGRDLAEALGYRHFRLYWSSDRLGVELGGAVKNVLAIAAGIVAGKALGASAHAALVARGFAELRRFAAAYGAQPQTMMGLSGLGDLILTCGSPQSRNMSLGRELGEGRTLDDILGRRRSVTEGVWTAAAVTKLARAKGVEMPIAEAVHGIVEGHAAVDDAIAALLSRPFKAEG